MLLSTTSVDLVGGTCGHDPRDRLKSLKLIPLLSCQKSISDHESAFRFSGHANEVDLILSRAGLFSTPKDITTWEICPLHRSKLGLGWRRPTERCRVPVEISKHGGKRRGKWPKGERGLGKSEASMILNRTGTFVQAGSGMSIILSNHFSVNIFNFELIFIDFVQVCVLTVERS